MKHLSVLDDFNLNSNLTLKYCYQATEKVSEICDSLIELKKNIIMDFFSEFSSYHSCYMNEE